MLKNHNITLFLVIGDLVAKNASVDFGLIKDKIQKSKFYFPYIGKYINAYDHFNLHLKLRIKFNFIFPEKNLANLFFNRSKYNCVINENILDVLAFVVCYHFYILV